MIIHIFVVMRIPSIFQRPAIMLLLGASALFCGPANALTFNWSWTATQGRIGRFFGGTDLTGTVVTGTIDNLVDNSLNTTGMTATFTGGFNVGQTVAYWGGAGIVVSNGTVVTSGLQAYFRSNDYDYSLQLEDPSGRIGVFGGAASGGPDSSLSMNNGTAPSFSSVSPVPVPAPLPILGLPAVLFYSRKLKKMIKASREFASASLA